MKKYTCYLMIGNGIFNQRQALRFAENSMGFKDLTPWIVELHHVISPFSSIVKQGKLASAPHETQESFGFLLSMAQDSWVKWFDGSFIHQKWWFSGNSMNSLDLVDFLTQNWWFRGNSWDWFYWAVAALDSAGWWLGHENTTINIYQLWSSIDIEGIMY